MSPEEHKAGVNGLRANKAGYMYELGRQLGAPEPGSLLNITDFSTLSPYQIVHVSNGYDHGDRIMYLSMMSNFSSEARIVVVRTEVQSYYSSHSRS